jgi:hypothetical protein
LNGIASAVVWGPRVIEMVKVKLQVVAARLLYQFSVTPAPRFLWRGETELKKMDMMCWVINALKFIKAKGEINALKFTEE